MILWARKSLVIGIKGKRSVVYYNSMRRFFSCSRNFVQNNKMAITNDRDSGFHLSELSHYHPENIETSLTKPVGLVPLVKPSTIENTAACYLAAAGGTWLHETVSIVFVIL